MKTKKENYIPEGYNLPEKLKQARKAFGISASFMGEILGFGPNEIRRYESGEAPRKSNYLAIRMAITPIGMMSYLNNSPVMIRAKKGFPELYFKVQAMCFCIDKEVERSKNMLNENYFIHFNK